MSELEDRFHPEPSVEPYLTRYELGYIRVIGEEAILDFGPGNCLLLWGPGAMEKFTQNCIEEGKIPPGTVLEGQRVQLQLHFLDVPYLTEEGV